MLKKTDNYRSTAYSGFYENAIEAMLLLKASKDLPNGAENEALKETLLKSCLVLMVACWESFIEDLLQQALQVIIENATSAKDIPKLLQHSVANELKNHKNNLAIWNLAGDGWKSTLLHHAEKNIAGFHNPKATNIDELFKATLGLENLSSSWESEQLKVTELSHELKKMIEQRGAIAHRVKSSHSLTESDLDKFGWLLITLSVMTNNSLRQYIIDTVKIDPWPFEDRVQFLIGRYLNG